MEHLQQLSEAASQWRSLKWPDGSRYDGLLKGDKQHTLGVMTFPNSDRYQGQWSDGHMDGYGVYVWNNGTIYRGEWVQGHMHGCGVRLSKDASGGLKALEGKFFADEYVGPILPCSSQDCLDAAVEADVAAHQAQSIKMNAAQQQQQQQQHASQIHQPEQRSQAHRQGPPGMADPAAEHRLSSLVQQLAANKAELLQRQQQRISRPP